jgi:hypothetical protein
MLNPMKIRATSFTHKIQAIYSQDSSNVTSALTLLNNIAANFPAAFQLTDEKVKTAAKSSGVQPEEITNAESNLRRDLLVITPEIANDSALVDMCRLSIFTHTLMDVQNAYIGHQIINRPLTSMIKDLEALTLLVAQKNSSVSHAIKPQADTSPLSSSLSVLLPAKLPSTGGGSPSSIAANIQHGLKQ